jgi:lysophospholipase L1-like esterase
MFLATCQTMGRYYYPPNYMQAVSGKTVPQMLANIPNVNAARPDVVTLKIGTNSMPTMTGAQVWAAYKQAAASYLLQGRATWVVFMPVPPEGGVNGPGSSYDNERLALNASIANFATDPDLALLKNNIVAVANYDSSFNTATMLKADNVHPNWLGAATMAAPMATALNSIISSGDLLGLYTDSTNILLAANNPQLSGTTGTKSNVAGQVATTWTASHVTSGGLPGATAAKTTLNGSPVGGAQECSVSGTNTIGAGTVFMRTLLNTTIANSVVTGEYYEAWVEFSIAAGNTGIETFSLKAANGGFTLGAGQVGTSAEVMTSGAAISGVLRTPAILISTNSSTMTFMVESVFANAVVAHDITVGRPFMRKILNP